VTLSSILVRIPWKIIHFCLWRYRGDDERHGGSFWQLLMCCKLPLLINYEIGCFWQGFHTISLFGLVGRVPKITGIARCDAGFQFGKNPLKIIRFCSWRYRGIFIQVVTCQGFTWWRVIIFSQIIMGTGNIIRLGHLILFDFVKYCDWFVLSCVMLITFVVILPNALIRGMNVPL